MCSDLTLHKASWVVLSSSMQNGSIKLAECLFCCSCSFLFHSSWQSRTLPSQIYVPCVEWSAGARGLYPRSEIGLVGSHPMLRGNEQGWSYCVRLFQVTCELHMNWWNKILSCATVGIPEAEATFLIYVLFSTCPHFSLISRAHSPHTPPSTSPTTAILCSWWQPTDRGNLFAL